MIKIKDKEFKIVIEHKRIKNIYLHFVYPDTIRVTCDFNVKEDFIMKLIESKKEWIYKASQRKAERIANTKLRIDDDIFYRGRKYHLECHEGNNGFRLDGDNLIIYSRKTGIENAIRVFYECAKNELLKDIIECQDKYLKILKDYGYQKQPVYKFRVMKSKWGVCYTRTNTVTINPMLIHFDKRYLEGVLWHELLHFIIPNHSKRFHEVLEYHMKDYKELMKGLK